MSSTSGSTNIDTHEFPENLIFFQNEILKYTLQGEYEEAISLCKVVVENLNKSLGDDHINLIVVQNVYAYVLRHQNKYQEATELLLDVLRIKEKHFGEDHILLAPTLNNLSALYGRQGKFREAEVLCRRALSIREKNENNIIGVALQLCNLAIICQYLKKYDEIENYYIRAMAIYLSMGIPNDPKIVNIKRNFAYYLKNIS